MTKKLIEEARRRAPYGRGSGDLLLRLADALEAQTGVRVDMGSAVGVESQLAARQPTEDDREVAMSAAREGLMSSYTDHWPDIQAQIVDSILAAGFSRAAVPDAATEPIDWQKIAVEQTRLERGRAEQAEAERDAALAAVPDAATERRLTLRVNHMQKLRDEARAERDAALAAVERVREMHRPESNERYTWCVGCSTDEYLVDWPCRTVAALDGAPEPEGGSNG